MRCSITRFLSLKLYHILAIFGAIVRSLERNNAEPTPRTENQFSPSDDCLPNLNEIGEIDLFKVCWFSRAGTLNGDCGFLANCMSAERDTQKFSSRGLEKLKIWSLRHLLTPLTVMLNITIHKPA